MEDANAVMQEIQQNLKSILIMDCNQDIQRIFTPHQKIKLIT